MSDIDNEQDNQLQYNEGLLCNLLHNLSMENSMGKVPLIDDTS